MTKWTKNKKTMGNDYVKVFSFEGNSVTFFDKNGTLYVNATEMAKPFGENKRPAKWLRTSSAEEYISTVSEVQKCPSADLQRVTKGGTKQQGTWFQKDVAMEFARWLSPMFALWCNRRIEELLTRGRAEAAQSFPMPKTYAEALRLAAEQAEKVEAQRAELEQRRQTIETQREQIRGLEARATYAETILRNKSTVTVTSIAQDYGMSAKRMNELLHELKIQFKNGTQWIVYSKYKAEGYVSSETVAISDKLSQTYTKWTQKGRLFLYGFLKSRGVLPLIERGGADGE